MRRAVIALLLLSACGSPTEVTVEIEADTRVRSEATQLDIQVFGAGPDTEFASVLERTLDAPTFPVRVTLAPRDGALDRRFRIEVVARDAMGATLASAQAEGRYQQGISERLQLELSEACTDIACDPGTVCVAGRCVAGDAGPRDAGPRDAGPTDGGPTDSGPTDSGPTDSGPTDSGPTDSGPTDSGPFDGGPFDGGPSDGGPSDGGPSDGGPPSTCGDGVCQVEDLDVCLAECDLVPTMTGPETPAGRVTTSGDFDLEHPAWHAFDSPAPDVSTMTGAFWLSEENVAPAWVAYDFPDGPHRVLRYGIRYGNGPALVSRAPRHFALEGWNGLEWVTVDTRMDETDWVAGEWRLFDIAGAGTRGFVSYRVIVFDDNDPRLGISTISIGELGLWGI